MKDILINKFIRYYNLILYLNKNINKEFNILV